MKDLILSFLSDFISIIFFLIIIYFIVRIIKMIKNRNLILNNSVLTRKEIAKRIIPKFNKFDFMFYAIWIVIISGITFSLIGIDNKVLVLTLGSLLLIFMIFLCINKILYYSNIMKGKYVVIVDKLVNKELKSSSNVSNINNVAVLKHSKTGMLFTFEDYYKVYNKKVEVKDYQILRESEIGDECYLVFVRNKVFVFRKNNFDLQEKDKIISVNDLGKYVK